ncbi:MAG: hypothetical protein WC144_01760 [Sulfurimonas sp.]|jgi:hypothetical protein|nr:hypothetical protein [Sulfurimonadaceae bacterium]
MRELLVEELYKELEDALAKIDDVAEMVQTKQLDAFEGFMQTEDLRTRANELLHEMKNRGIEVEKRIEELLGGS